MSVEEIDTLAKVLFLADLNAVEAQTGERMWETLTAQVPTTAWHEQAERALAAGVRIEHIVNGLPAAEFYKQACMRQEAEIERLLAPALGFEWAEEIGGWNTGEHTAESLAMMAAERLEKIRHILASGWGSSLDAQDALRAVIGLPPIPGRPPARGYRP